MGRGAVLAALLSNVADGGHKPANSQHWGRIPNSSTSKSVGTNVFCPTHNKEYERETVGSPKVPEIGTNGGYW